MAKKARGALSLYSRWIVLSVGAMLATAPLAATSPAHAAAYTFTQINVPSATGMGTNAYGISDAGQIVGTFDNGTGDHGFLDTGGHFTQIDVPGIPNGTEAYGINNRGQIVGWSFSGGFHGFLATPNGMGLGDPHLTTFDSRPYNFYAVGEFVLAQSTVAGDLFDVQI